MFPILIQFPDWLPVIGGKALHTYGALVAIGFLAGMLWVKRESRRAGLPVNPMMDLFFTIILAAIVGSRLFYVVISVPEWWRDPLVFFRVWEGGLVFYGGLIASVLVSVWYCKKHRHSFLKVADTFTPGIALGHLFGRLGCLTAGCCYGKPAPEGFPLSIIFPETLHSIAPSGVPLYPTQLMEASGIFLVFMALFFFRKFKKFDGEIFLLYIILYPVIRSILEIYRGDAIRGFVIEGVLSTSQLISILWVILALVLWATLARRKKV